MRKQYILYLSIITLLFKGQPALARILEVPSFTTTADLPNYVLALFQFGIEISTIIAALGLVFGGIAYVVSMGDSSKMTDAKSRIINAIIGILILSSCYLILNAINPRLTTLDNPKLIETGGLIFVNGTEKRPAIYWVEDITEEISKQSIVWPKDLVNEESGGVVAGGNCKTYTDTDALGNTTTKTLDNAAYVVYFFDGIGYQQPKTGPVRLKCGDPTSVWSGAKSYKIIYEEPGVYLYPGNNCSPSGSNMPILITRGVSSWSDFPVASIRIVNGDDPKKGPFYGVMTFRGGNGINGNGYKHYAPCNNFNCKDQVHWVSECINLTDSNAGIVAGSSVIVYKWVGYKSDYSIGAPGAGITFYTGSALTGGSEDITGEDIINGANGGMFEKNLKDLKPTYEINQTGTDGTKEVIWDSGVSKEEQARCPNFQYSQCDQEHVTGDMGEDYERPESYNTTVKHCLWSAYISGNYLMVLTGKNEANIGTPVQLFPSVPSKSGERSAAYQVDRGPSDLSLEWFYKVSKCEEKISIIPLAEPLYGNWYY